MILRLQKKQREHSRFYALLLILIVFLFTRYSFGIDIPRIALTGTIALIALAGNREEILAIALCCIPLHEAVDFFYALVACASVYTLKYHREIRINMSVILALVIITWELLHAFATGASVVKFLFSMVSLIFLAFVLCIDISDIDYAFVVRTVAGVTAITCAVLFLNQIVLANYNIASAISGLQRLGLVSESSETNSMLGGVVNPNALGVICVLMVTGLLQLRARRENQGKDIFLVIILLLFGALTASRTFFVCLVFVAALFIWGYPGGRGKKLRFLGMVATCVVVVLLLLHLAFPELLEYYISRFFEDDITTGRDNLMTIYHHYILDNPDVMFFGIGRMDYTTKLTEVYNISKNIPHNSIQEIIVAWGIPGLLMFAVLLGTMVSQSRKYCKHHTLLNFIPIMVIIFKSMAGQLLTSTYTMLALSYAYLSLAQDFTRVSETNNKFILHTPEKDLQRRGRYVQ